MRLVSAEAQPAADVFGSAGKRIERQPTKGVKWHEWMDCNMRQTMILRESASAPAQSWRIHR